MRLREPQCPLEQRDPHSWLALERLDYSPLAGRWAVVRLVAGLGADAALPTGARLVVERGQTSSSHGAFVSAADRRVQGTDSELLWVASFAVPLEIVECPSALFQLMAPGRGALALPMPGSLILPPTYFADPAFRRWFPGHMRYRLAALATAMAVAASSSSVTGLALAAGSSPGSAHVEYGRTTPDSAWQLPICPPNPPVGLKCRLKPPAKQRPKDSVAPAAHKPSPKDPARHKPAAPAKHVLPAQPAAPPTPNRPAAPAAPAAAPKHKRKHPAHPTPATHSAPIQRDPKLPAHHAPPMPSAHPAPTKPALGPHSWSTHDGNLDKRVAIHPKKRHHHVPARPSHPTGGAAISKLVTRPHLKPAHKDEDTIPALTTAPGAPERSSGLAAGIGANPAIGLELSHMSGLFANVQGPPVFLIPIYKQAGRRYHVPWQVLAAINSVETDYGRNLNVSSAGAIGWMQFMPDTWRAYGITANGRGRPNPYNPRDAIFSAANYLNANGARHHLRRAIFAYNHATWYVDEVLWRAQTIKDRSKERVTGHAGKKLTKMIAMADLLNGLPYVWGGGHSGWQLVSGYDCSGFVSAVLHAAGYLSAPQTTATLPSQPGIQDGPGQYVTIFDRTAAGAQGHVIIDLNGTFYESGGSAFGGGGAGVKRIRQPPADYLVTFDRMLHPAGM